MTHRTAEILMVAVAAATVGAGLIPATWAGALADPHPPASQLAATLLERHGVSPPLAALAALDVDPASGALAAVLRDFLALEDAASAAYANARLDVDLEAFRDRPAEAVWAATGVDLGAVLGAREHLLASVEALGKGLPLAVSTLEISLPPALEIHLGPCADNVYTIDTVLTIDACGNDVSFNNAGGSALGNAHIDSCGLGIGAAAALMDFAGDDRRLSDRGCGINGGANNGVGFLYDEAGNDVYVAKNDGTNGGAKLGAGFLLDVAGRDVYDAGGWGTNGGGYPGGIGFLRDEGGDDVYTATFEAVNGGGVSGVGLLEDLGGHDWYADDEGVVGWDLNVWGKGAIGFLIDH